jgi:hypothetical protein
MPKTRAEESMADDDGRFFLDRVTRPIASRKRNLGLVRRFELVNLLMPAQVTLLSADKSLSELMEKFTHRKFASGARLIVIDEKAVDKMNMALKMSNFLI